MEQMSFLDFMGEQANPVKVDMLDVVQAKFISKEKKSWQELFDGFDELYGITFSSGLGFMGDVLERFSYAEVIMGCEEVMNPNLGIVMSVETSIVEQIVRDKNAVKLSRMMEEKRLKLFVSRDTKSHEKIYLLKSNQGAYRVIIGSANMSASAFCGFQRENIIYFDDKDAYDWYYERFVGFREKCSDNIKNETILRMIDGEEDLLRDDIEQIPISETVKAKKVVIIEPAEDDKNQIDIVADVKGLEMEIKPMLPKPKKDGNIVFTAEELVSVKSKHAEHRKVKKLREKQLPKLHIDYERHSMSFNGKECNLQPSKDAIANDINRFITYMSSLAIFYGNIEQSQMDFYRFMNWYFASVFMPYLRYIGNANNYEMTPFPVVGIIYGDSNGGKSTFVKLLSKMMSGTRIAPNCSDDFTGSNIEKLKRACEGVPINIDDLAKTQYQNHFEKVIKDDYWGIRDHFINYPAVVITTNKLPSVSNDISKRAVLCRIDTKLDKETGVKNSKKINESLKEMTNSFFCEYMRRMFDKIDEIQRAMSEEEEYFPDIFATSSKVLYEIFEENCESVPDYVRILEYGDYFGDKAIGKNAIKKVLDAWENEKEQFEIDKKKNQLRYIYPEKGRTYELKYIMEELPPSLNAKLMSHSIVMDLDQAKEFFAVEFRKKRFWQKE